MSLSRQGFKKAQRLLERLPETTARHLADANEDNAALIERVAKVLVPVGKTAKAKAAIKRTPEPDGGQMIDFGPLSSILEGGTQERQHKDGHRTGKGSPRPFVNPALKATFRSRRARANKAVRDATKEAGNG